MTRYFFPVLMIAVSVGIYILFIDPLYDDMKAHQAQITQLNEALRNADRIIARRDELQNIIRNIPEADLDRLQKILPDNIDNVRLILEIDQLATANGLLLRDADVQTTPTTQSNRLGPDLEPQGTVNLKLTLAGTYDNFRQFVREFDRMLRIVDVANMSLAATDQVLGTYVYNLEVRAFWIK